MTFRKAIANIHLWLGLSSALIVLILGITGCIFAFQTEISEAIHHDQLFIKAPEGTSVLPLSRLEKIAQAKLGDSARINYITTYRNPQRTWEFMAYKENEKASSYFNSFDYYCSVFLNPYTGEVTGIKNYSTDFFNIIKYLHCALLLKYSVGAVIVDWSTFLFVISLLTGLVLWWPKKWNKTTLRRNFTVKWNARFKRVNYDLHNVLGFYALLLALVLGMTGMVFGFKWFREAVYVVASGTTIPPEEIHTHSVILQGNNTSNGLDKAFWRAKEDHPFADRTEINPASGPEEVIYISAYRGKEVYYNRDDMQFDQYNGKLLHRQSVSASNKGVKLINMNYDIHVGAIGGIWGKIIAFFISLISASLPVTGFLYWWGKRSET